MDQQHDFPTIVSQFQFDGTLQDTKSYGSGHINDTFLVRTIDNTGGDHAFILQRINHEIFTCPENVMENIEAVTEHLRQKILANGGDAQRETLTLIRTRDGKTLHKCAAGNYWRSYRYIPDTVVYQVVEDDRLFGEAGKAFGRFQQLLSDFPVNQLHETIVDFHHTGKRFEQFKAAVTANRAKRAHLVTEDIEFVRAHAADTTVLVDLMARGQIPIRVIHNDTKLNNIMFDKTSGAPICIVDLDTVMPGLSLYDYGDAIRCGTNRAEEDEPDLSKVWMDLDLFAGFTRGYLETAGDSLTPAEIAYMPFAAKLIALELGMRFLTDHLNGDVYFRIHREGHNLDRARTQLKLVADMETKFHEMTRIVAQYAP